MRVLIAYMLLLVAATFASAQTAGGGQTGVRAPTLSIQVTDPGGAPIAGVDIQATGPVTRQGTTAVNGTALFTNLRTGVYRLRFSRERFITLERDVAVRAGQSARADVMLSAAPASAPELKPEPPPEPPAPEPVPAGPVGEPKTMSIPDHVEANFIGRAQRKDSPLGCTGSGAATLLQLREVLADHSHDASDEWLYVVAGEGTLKLGDRQTPLIPGSFSVIPRTVAHAVTPRGRNPLIVVSILSGEPCQR